MTQLETKLLEALEACRDVMSRIHPEGLPIEPGTLCEEQDWITALRLAGDAIGAAAFVQQYSNKATVRHDLRTGQFIPQVNGKDIGVTTFDADRAQELAEQAAKARPAS